MRTHIVTVVCLVCALAVLVGCGSGNAPSSRVAQQYADDGCTYAQQVATTLASAQRILSEGVSGNPTKIRASADEMSRLAVQFVAIEEPESGKSIEANFSKALIAYGEMLRALSEDRYDDAIKAKDVATDYMDKATDDTATMNARLDCR